MKRIINRLNSKLCTVFATLCLFTACNSNVLVEETRTIDNKVWDNQIISFEFDIQDTVSTYDIVLEVEHDTEFPFQNIYTEVTVTFPDATPQRVMPVSIDLADDLGNWIGKCSGQKCITPLAFMTNTKFIALGKHGLTFKQFSRLPQIEGISKLRLKLIRLD